MTSLALKCSHIAGQFLASMNRAESRIARAATATMREGGANLKTKGRSNIAVAGFSSRWQNAFRVNVYPSRGSSIDAAAFAYHKIPYSLIFETGGTIKGKPMLWLPFSGVLARLGHAGRMSPREFVAMIAPLHRVDRRLPLLVAYLPLSTNPQPLTLAKLRAGNRKFVNSGRGAVYPVAVYFGLDSATIKKKFNIKGVTEQVMASLDGIYSSKFAATKG